MVFPCAGSRVKEDGRVYCLVTLCPPTGAEGSELLDNEPVRLPEGVLLCVERLISVRVRPCPVPAVPEPVLASRPPPAAPEMEPPLRPASFRLLPVAPGVALLTGVRSPAISARLPVLPLPPPPKTVVL